MDYNARMYDASLMRFVQPDTIVGGQGSTQGLNRYAYVDNCPINKNDPTGYCPICVTIAVGALIGGGISYISQVVSNISKNGWSSDPLTKDVNWKSVGVAALSGAVAGAVGFGVGAAVAALGGTSLAATIVGGVISGAVSGQTSRATVNLLTNQSWNTGLGKIKDIATDAIIGGVSAGIGYGVGKLIEPKSSGPTVYRVWGEEPTNMNNPKGSGPWGASWTTENPYTIPNYRDAAGLPSGGGSGSYNYARFGSIGKLVDSEGVKFTTAMSLDGMIGGLTEVIVPNPMRQIILTGVYGINPPY